jgi:predicted nucleotidyltransferase
LRSEAVCACNARRVASARIPTHNRRAVIDLIQQHPADLEGRCRKHHVKSLEVFGSAADGTFDSSHSDLDFLVEILSTASGRIFHGYFHLRDDLERLFGHPVDLVMPGAIRNPCLLKSVNRQRQTLYVA